MPYGPRLWVATPVIIIIQYLHHAWHAWKAPSALCLPDKILQGKAYDLCNVTIMNQAYVLCPALGPFT